jgi:hypothetical protein
MNRKITLSVITLTVLICFFYRSLVAQVRVYDNSKQASATATFNVIVVDPKDKDNHGNHYGWINNKNIVRDPNMDIHYPPGQITEKWLKDNGCSSQQIQWLKDQDKNNQIFFQLGNSTDKNKSDNCITVMSTKF